MKLSVLCVQKQQGKAVLSIGQLAYISPILQRMNPKTMLLEREVIMGKLV